MTAGLGASAYVDVPAYLRAPTNQETDSLLGLNTVVAGPSSTPAGATTLPVASSTGWAAAPLWLLDGPYPEVVSVTAAPDSTHLTLAAPGTRFAHAPSVSASQAGASGSLADSPIRSLATTASSLALCTRSALPAPTPRRSSPTALTTSLPS